MGLSVDSNFESNFGSQAKDYHSIKIHTQVDRNPARIVSLYIPCYC